LRRRSAPLRRSGRPTQSLLILTGRYPFGARPKRAPATHNDDRPPRR